MSTWRGSIFGFNRAWLAPSPRTLNWFQEAVVLAHGDSVHLQRFLAGARSGDNDVFTDWHTFDGRAFGKENAAINGASAATMIKTARSAPSAAHLAGLHPDNVLIGIDEVAAVRAVGKGSHASVTVTTGGGNQHTIWITTAAPASSSRSTSCIR